MLGFYVFAAFIKNRMSNQHKVIDIETDTVSDFSIMVTYLPKTARESEIKEFFEQQFPGVQVAQISMAYDIEKLTKLTAICDHEEKAYLDAVKQETNLGQFRTGKSGSPRSTERTRRQGQSGHFQTQNSYERKPRKLLHWHCFHHF